MGSQRSISMNRKELAVINEFRYLGLMIGKDSSRKAKVENRVLQGRSGGGPQALMNGTNISVVCAGSIHHRLLIVTLMYGCVTLIFLG